MRGPLLELSGVARRFITGDTASTVLDGVDLSIRAGEFVAIVGASGSGKSTLMNILGCLDRPSAGSYRIDAIDTSTLSHDKLARLRRERFGFIFQRYHLLPHMSAAANVEMPAVYAGIDRRRRQARALELLSRLGLEDRAQHRPNQLSGGQQQRVSIARALMNGGEIILADEPTGALDSRSGEEVLRILHELHAAGHTIVVVTHDEHVAANAQRIVEMRDGAIVRDYPNERPSASVVEAPREPPAAVTATLSERTQPATHDLSETGARGAAQNVSSKHRAHWARGAALSRLAEACRMGWLALAAHRLRTLLTMLGIVIGILSVVSIVAIGEGAKRYMLEDLSRVGTHAIGIYPGRDWGDTDASAIRTLVPADAGALRELHYVDSATPVTSNSQLLRVGREDIHVLVSGVDESYFRVRGLRIVEGIAFSAEHVRRYSQVAVIDEPTRRKVFGSKAEALGKVILIENMPCVVIGVAAEFRDPFGGMKELQVWLPYTTAGGRLFGQRHVDRLTVRIKAGQPSEAAEAGIVKLLTQRHGRKDFFTYNMDSMVKSLEKMGRSLTLFLTLVAVVSLVVGGIGVMNIMLVSVTERTREIGIRMAVGARRSDVMQQFLVEAVLVCAAGGAMGLVGSYGASLLFSYFVHAWQMIFSAEAIVAAFVCSTLIGVAFGFAPARNAARLDPVEALARD
jgi:macrolide transport system ATP-binding/permease protein